MGMAHETLRLYDHFFKQLEEFEKWAKGEQRISPIYSVEYCPICKDIKLDHHYSPDDDDDYRYSPMMRRYRVRFEPCGHDIDAKKERILFCNLPSDLQKKYREMEQLEFQFKIFKEKLKDIERAKIEYFKVDMNMLQVIKNRTKKIKIKKEKK